MTSLPPQEAPRKARLAGLVLALTGLFTFGVTSPFGLILSAEKLWETDRPRLLRICDIVGVVLAWVGNIFLPYFLYLGWNDKFYVGPERVTAYLGFLVLWMVHRVFVVWRSGVTGPWSNPPDTD